MERTKIGIIGCGVICHTYLHNITTWYKSLDVAAVADLYVDKAREVAAQYGVPRACTVDELLADPEITLVCNLTIPAAHREINLKALAAGKHVYCEKPFALSMADAEEQAAFARERDLLLGCAPDTFLGAGLQTCRRIIDDGWIGEPVAATVNLVSHGHETWHPAPEFFYREGAGPMLDMGPYYITALVSLLGPVKRVDCYGRKTFGERLITSQAQKGKSFGVDVLTHYAGLMEFADGLIANINMSFDVWLSNLPMLEVYGTEGTLVVPDPNMFTGPVKVLRGNSMVDSVEGMDVAEAVEVIHSEAMFDFFREVPLLYPNPAPNMRGMGLLDMAWAIQNGREHRTNPDFACHVLEVLLSFDESAKTGQTQVMQTSCERPRPLPTGLAVGQMG